MSLLGLQFGPVHRATDAAEALCLVEQPAFARQLQLVISGHHTKGFGGPAFVAELTDRVKVLPVLVLGMDDESPEDYPGDHIAFLAEPHIPHKLVSLTRKILSLQKLRVA